MAVTALSLALAVVTLLWIASMFAHKVTLAAYVRYYLDKDVKQPTRRELEPLIKWTAKNIARDFIDRLRICRK